MEQSLKPYPKSANFDDRIIAKDDVLYDVFVFGKEFKHIELTQKQPAVTPEGFSLKLSGDKLHCNGKEWLGDSIDKHIVILPHSELSVHTIALPKENITISNSPNATLTIGSASFAVLEARLDKQLELSGYILRLSSNGGNCYFNSILTEDIHTSFNIGDRLVIDKLCIERRPNQLKITGLGTKVLYSETALLEEPFKPEYPADFPEYRRSPRIMLMQPRDRVKISGPEAKPEKEKGQMLKTVLPPLGMVAAGALTTVISGGNPLMMIGMAGASLLTTGFTVSSYFTNKKELKKKTAAREETYDIYLLEKQAQLNKLEAQQRNALKHHFPDADTLAEMAERYDSRIYEKNPTHGDFLEFSLGIGNIPASYSIEFNADEQKNDELVQYANDEIVNPRRMLKNAPITTTLLGETFGFAGNYPILRTAVSNLLFQVAMFHSYRDVEFIALVPEEGYEKEWGFWRWLPHFQIKALNLRGFIHHVRSRDITLNSFYQMMNKRKQAVRETGSSEKPKFSPHYILAILDGSHLAGHGLNEFLAEDMSRYGVTVIWCKDTPSMLPETVTTMVRYYSSRLGELVNESGEYVAKEFVPNPLPTKISLKTVIQRLANLHHMEVEKNAIPQSVTFLEMYNVKKVNELNVEGRWSKANSAKTLAVPLGLRGRDDIVELNLHERAHGPHGLVAGTTGSGKSEIVQSYILSLAINFAPEDVGFLPIDFKGGGMANEFKGLPHLLGSITNLDGASSARALASIRAELKKRQRMFSKYGVNHINAYTKLYKQGKNITDAAESNKYPEDPIPHLFLISDEFAELKANEPEFMAELVSTARIGRSLGVHLILATQKPSGVVDDQIWSNSRFKLALKVADASDSNEIIKTPDAASITEPGRAYLQVGNNEIFELFQSAWSGATYDPNAIVEEKVDDRIWLINDLGQYQLLSTDLSEESDKVQATDEDLPTQLRAIVAHIAEVATEQNAILPPKPWLPPLETAIVTPGIETASEWKETRDLSVPLALMDIPSRQTQKQFIFDFEKLSHTVIYGSAGFGKSTILQTLVMNLARKNNPEQVQFNLLDFGTNGLLPLKNMPHVADLARLEETEKLTKFIVRIRGEVAKRKELFTAAGVSSLSQYEEKTKHILPVIITVVDSYDPMRESPLEEACESVLNQLLRDGASVGMYLVMTGIRANTFKVSMTGNIPNQIALFLVEENAMKDVIGRDALIAEEIIGRGQIKLDEPFSVQFYLPAEGSSDLLRMNNIEDEIKLMTDSWKGNKPKPIPMVPKVLSMYEYYSNPDVKRFLDDGNLPLGLNMDTTEVVGFKPSQNRYFLIADGQPSQTEYLERVICENFKLLNGKYNRVVFDGQDRFTGKSDIFDTIISSLDFSDYANITIDELDKRLETGSAGEKPILIYVPDIPTFANKTMLMEEKMQKLLRKGADAGMHFLFHGEKSKIDISYDDVSKTLRSNPPAGLVGSKRSEQNYVSVKSDFSEPMVEHDQHHYFAGRVIVKIRLVSED